MAVLHWKQRVVVWKKIILKIKIRVEKSRKHCGERRKCCLPAFAPFPLMFSKAFFSRGVKSRDYVVKG